MNVFFIGDLHFGHKGIIKYREFATEADHRAFLMERWRCTVREKDLVYVLGDAAFTDEGLDDIGALPGRKILVRGNHDGLKASRFLDVFEDVHGMLGKYKMWLTHAPIHPDELRGKVNIHGHVHFKTIPDRRYVNVSAEVIGYTPISLQEVRNYEG